MPWALELSERWAHPLSGVDLIVADPDFVDYVESEGTSNKTWYTAEHADTANTFVEQDMKVQPIITTALLSFLITGCGGGRRQ